MDINLESLEGATTEHERRIDEAAGLLPAWFIPRMMDDEWRFGLLLATGRTLVIQHIDEVNMAADGSLWIDARMAGDPPLQGDLKWISAPTSRTNVSINVAHIVAAFEVADT